MYVDASTNCNMLAFQIGNTAVGVAATAARAWSIKVRQQSMFLEICKKLVIS